MIEMGALKDLDRFSGTSERCNTRACFVASALLVNGLIGACTQKTAYAQIDNSVPAQMKEIEKADSGSGRNALGAGSYKWVGVPWKTMYNIKIASSSEDKVTLDLTLPLDMITDSAGPVRAAVKIRGLEIWEGKTDVSNMLCTKDGAGKKAGAMMMRLPKHASDAFPQFAGMLERKLGSVLGEFFSISKDPSRIDAQDLKKADFEIECSGSKEFVLKAKGPEFEGKRLRLGRELSLEMEFLFDKPASYSIPFLIENLSVGSHGNVEVKVEMDKTRLAMIVKNENGM